MEEEVIALNNRNKDDIKIFTDRSGQNGHIGAAEVFAVTHQI